VLRWFSKPVLIRLMASVAGVSAAKSAMVVRHRPRCLDAAKAAISAGILVRLQTAAELTTVSDLLAIQIGIDASGLDQGRKALRRRSRVPKETSTIRIELLLFLRLHSQRKLRL
jgi:hypothetical protein